MIFKEISILVSLLKPDIFLNNLINTDFGVYNNNKQTSI